MIGILDVSRLRMPRIWHSTFGTVMNGVDREIMHGEKIEKEKGAQTYRSGSQI